MFPEFRNSADIIAIRTFYPKSLRSFFLFRGFCADAFLDTFKPTAFRFFRFSFFSGQVRIKVLNLFSHNHWLRCKYKDCCSLWFSPDLLWRGVNFIVRMTLNPCLCRLSRLCQKGLLILTLRKVEQRQGRLRLLSFL